MKRADTVLTHAGRSPADQEGMVNPPVYRTSTVIFPTLASYEKRHELGDHGVRYGRHGTPTTFAFERAVAELEGGYRSVALPNGLAAIASFSPWPRRVAMYWCLIRCTRQRVNSVCGD